MVKKKVLISGLTFLGVANVAAAVAISLSSCSEDSPSETNTYQEKISDLFVFDKFLPSEATKTAMVDTAYENCASVEENAKEATSQICNLYKTQLCNLLNLSADLINAQVQGDFKFNFTINLNDDICQKLYKKSFAKIKETIENTSNYNELFDDDNSNISPINSIKISFCFSKHNAPISNDLMGFTLNQKALLTFNNNTEKVIDDILNSNNNQFNTKKMLFFIKFGNQANGKKDGDSVDLNAISLTEKQVDNLMQILQNNIASWTKKDVLFVNKQLPELPDDPSYARNEHYKFLINDINDFFKEENLDLEINKMNISNMELWENNDNHFVGIKPFLAFKSFRYIELPNNKFYYSYDKYTDQWFLFVNDSNPVYTHVKYETLKLGDADINRIKGYIDETMNEIKEIQNIEWENGNISSPECIINLTNNINEYISTISNGKFQIEPNIWGGCNSYKFNEKEKVWKMSFGIIPKSVDPELNKNSFFKISVPEKYDKEKNSDIYPSMYDLNDALIFTNIKTNIPPELIISKQVATNINQILKDFSATLTNEESNEDMFKNHSDVVEKLNTELANINPELKVTGFNVNGGWPQQSTSNGFRTLGLGINLNLVQAGFYENDVIVKSDLFTFDSDYHCLYSKEKYVTKMIAAFDVPKNVENELNQILSNFCATLTIQESNTDLFNNHKDIVDKINAQLLLINPQLSLKGFNVWGNWNQQGTSNGHKTVLLGLEIDFNGLIISNNDNLFNFSSNSFTYSKIYHIIVPTKPFDTNIKI